MEDYQSHAYNVNAAVEMLQNVDGETMELILKKLVWSGKCYVN